MKTSFLTASKAFLRYKIDPNSQKQFKLRNRAVNQQRKLQDDPEVKVKKQRLTVDPSTNGHLSTTATFLADCPYIDSCLNVCTKATFFCPQGGRCRQVQLYYITYSKLIVYASSEGVSWRTKFVVLLARFKDRDNTHSKGEGLEIFNMSQENLFFDHFC